ncbi:MAG: NUDIX hydrolase [Gammaproteobacteria bacterium]
MQDSPLFYCPKCGNHTLAKANRKWFECKRCTFTVYRNVAAAVAAIIECDGGIIVTRRAKEPQKGKLGLAGGFVDADETLEEALRREVEEELGGMRIYDLRYLCSFPNTYPFEGIDYFTIDSVFVCKSDSKEMKPAQDEAEHAEILDPRKLNLEDVAFSSLRNALKRYVEHI